MKRYIKSDSKYSKYGIFTAKVKSSYPQDVYSVISTHLDGTGPIETFSTEAAGLEALNAYVGKSHQIKTSTGYVCEVYFLATIDYDDTPYDAVAAVDYNGEIIY